MTEPAAILYTLCKESTHQRRSMQGVYPVFSIRDAVRRELSWTHVRLPSQIESKVSP